MLIYPPRLLRRQGAKPPPGGFCVFEANESQRLYRRFQSVLRGPETYPVPMAQPRESTVSHMLDQYIELTPGAAGPIVHKDPPAASVAGIGATLRCGSSFFPGMKTNVYIDGLNLYYGAIRGTPYKWLDVGKLCSRVLPPYASLNRIRYFTAVVKSRPDDPHAPVRQATHFRALGTIPNLTIHEGQFRSNERLVRLVHPIEGLGRTTIKRALVQKDEEKGSDVNLASWLLIDGFRRDFQSALVISNDFRSRGADTFRAAGAPSRLPRSPSASARSPRASRSGDNVFST